MKSKAAEEPLSESGEINLSFLGKEFPALHDIRDRVLMLSLGNAFLCEEAFLKKTGSAMESQLENLRQEIHALKAMFPGKFATDIDTDSILEDLHGHTKRLQNPNKGLTDKCTVGVLGRELEETLGVLTAAVRKIKRKVGGETPAYTAKDAVAGVLGKAKAPVSLARRVVAVAVKAVFVLLLLSLGPLTYLALTMDREGALLEEIRESELTIHDRQAIIASAEREKEALYEKIQVLQTEDIPRGTKVEILEMNVKIHGLDQIMHRAQVEIGNQEEKIRDRERRVQVIREKSFLARFLRR